MIEVDCSQELVKRLDGIGPLYLQDAVNSVGRRGDAIFADCMAQEIESRLAEDALVPVNHQIVVRQHLKGLSEVLGAVYHPSRQMYRGGLAGCDTSNAETSVQCWRGEWHPHKLK